MSKFVIVKKSTLKFVFKLRRVYNGCSYILLDIWQNMLIKSSKQIGKRSCENKYKGEFKTLLNICQR